MTGLLLGLGKTRAGNVGIVILSGMIFGLSHFQYHNLETMIWMCIFTGIPFAAIYLNTGNLLVCMLLHASSNIFISSMNLLVPLEQQILINPVFNYYYQIIMLGLILICGIVQTLITKPRKVNPVINNE